MKLRVTPGSVGLVVVKLVASPKVAARMSAAAALKAEWPETYDGCAGVMSSDCQAASCTLAALPSWSDSWIAVTGRQTRKVYFVSQQAMAASASATFNCAISRALAASPLPLSAATCPAMRFQCPGGV